MMLLQAVTRFDIANYVSTLFLVYIVLIFVYILLNMLFSFGVRTPYARWSDARPLPFCGMCASPTCGSSER